MPLETGTIISDLNSAWPLGSDPKSQGDDHIRLIKSILQSDAVSRDGVENGTETELDARYAALADVGPVEIVEADISARWQVWGDVLVQWGSVSSSSSGSQGVSFPQAFKTAPSVQLTSFDGNFRQVSPSFSSEPSTTGFQFAVYGTADNRVTNTVKWTAIGEAPDALKKPKIIQTVGGAELQEFYDPAGAESWRIVGNTLELWGTAALTDGFASVVTSKIFANTNFRLTANLTVDNLPGNVWGIYTKAFANNRFEIRGHNTGTTSGIGLSGQCYWHAIGEWDGVS